jgi:hypothetical protein
VTNHTDFGWIPPRLRQSAINSSCEIKWFKAPIRLLALTVANSSEVKAQRYHPCFGQTSRQRNGQCIIHVTAGRLKMTQNDYGNRFYFCGRMEHSL